MAASLDDVLDELRKQTQLSAVANTVAAATQALVARMVPGGAPGGGTPAQTPTSPAAPRTSPAAPPATPGGQQPPGTAPKPPTTPAAPPGPPPTSPGGQQPTGTPPNKPPAASPGGQTPAPQPNQPTPKPTPKAKKTKPGFFGRAWQNSRFGQSYARNKGATGRALGGKGKGGTKGLGGVAGGAAKAAGAVGVIVTVVQSLNEFRKAVIRVTDEQLNAARRFREMSGHMDVIFAQTDMKDDLRKLRQGAAQSASTKRLADADQRRKNAMESLENSIANTKNELLALLNDALVPPLKLCAEVAKVLEKWLQRLGFKREAELPEPAGLAADMARVRAEADRIEADGRRMMDAARAAARGRVYPAGGRIP